jgi:uncharacterized protein YbjT (DUF2867 family)
MNAVKPIMVAKITHPYNPNLISSQPGPNTSEWFLLFFTGHLKKIKTDMKVLVIGANGQIGTHLVELLKEHDAHTPIAMIRNEEQQSKFEEKGVETVLADLEDSVDALADAAKGSNAIVFTAGSGGKTGPDKTLLIDLDGAAKAVEAAEKAGVDRFLIVSAIQAHRRENWSPKIKHYFAAKHHADRAVEHSSLNFTIIRPGGLTNYAGTGKIKAATDLGRDMIPREDVAKTIIAALEAKNTYRKGFDLVSGETPVEEAIASL